MSFLDHIARCNNANLANFEPWFIGPTQAGFLHRDFLPRIAPRADLFSHRDGAWYLSDAVATAPVRPGAPRHCANSCSPCAPTAGFKKAARDGASYVEYGIHTFTMMCHGRHWSPVVRRCAFGPHMTGYVRKPDAACILMLDCRPVLLEPIFFPLFFFMMRACCG